MGCLCRIRPKSLICAFGQCASNDSGNTRMGLRSGLTGVRGADAGGEGGGGGTRHTKRVPDASVMTLGEEASVSSTCCKLSLEAATKQADWMGVQSFAQITVQNMRQLSPSS